MEAFRRVSRLTSIPSASRIATFGSGWKYWIARATMTGSVVSSSSIVSSSTGVLDGIGDARAAAGVVGSGVVGGGGAVAGVAGTVAAGRSGDAVGVVGIGVIGSGGAVAGVAGAVATWRPGDAPRGVPGREGGGTSGSGDSGLHEGCGNSELLEGSVSVTSLESMHREGSTSR
jgi:hypothetical protein